MTLSRLRRLRSRPRRRSLRPVCPACGEAAAWRRVLRGVRGRPAAHRRPAGSAVVEPEVRDEGCRCPPPVPPPCPSCGAAGRDRGGLLRRVRDEAARPPGPHGAGGRRGGRRSPTGASATTATRTPSPWPSADGRVVGRRVRRGVDHREPRRRVPGRGRRRPGRPRRRRRDLPAAYAAARAAVLAVPWVPDPRRAAPSCTFLAAVVDGDRGRAGLLGDCRAFWLPPTAPTTQLTEDDSWAAEARSPPACRRREEAYADRLAHVITRWLGADADPVVAGPAVSLRRPRARPPAALLRRAVELRRDRTPTWPPPGAGAGDPVDLLAAARWLTDFANAAGGSDNITVVLVDLPCPLHHSKGPAA